MATKKTLHPKRAANPQARRPKHQKKELDFYVKAAWNAGWWCDRGGNNYIRLWPPDDSGMVCVPSTPSGRYAANHLGQKLRKKGLAV